MHKHTKSQNSSSKDNSSVGGRSRGLRSLSERDHKLLRLVAEQRMVRSDHLAGLLGCRPSEVRRVLERLVRDGYVEQQRFLVMEKDPWVWLTLRGVQVADTGYAYYEPKVGALAHTAETNEVRLGVFKRHPRAKWVCERALWRQDGRVGVHLADGAYELAGKRHAIEVELTPKWPKRVAEIVEELSERFDFIDYHCTPATRRVVEAAQREYGFTNVRIHDLATEVR
jgi:DNA-binding MarR family transcriptional regulator